MAYTVRMLFPNQGNPPRTEMLDGSFGSVEEAWDAGTARALEFQLRSTEAAFQILTAKGQIVEVTGRQKRSSRSART